MIYYSITRHVSFPEFAMDENRIESNTNNCNLTVEDNIKSDVDIYLNVKKPEDAFIYIYKNEPCPTEADASTVNNEVNQEAKVWVIVEKTASNTKKKASKKKATNSQLLTGTCNQNKNLKKTSKPNKVVKQKPTRKSSRIAAINLSKIANQKENELINYTKMELYKLNSERYLKQAFLSQLAYALNDPNSTSTMNIPHYAATKQQELNQLCLDNSRNMLQYSDYNNLRHLNQQATMTNSNFLQAPRNDQNLTLNNVTNIQYETKSSNFSDNKYCYTYGTAATDYNQKQNENPNFPVGSINYYTMKNNMYNNPYPLENNMYNNRYYPYNFPGASNTWNNVYSSDFPRMNATSQEVANNVALKYSTSEQMTNNVVNYATSTATANSANFANVTTELYNNPASYYQSIQAGYNSEKLNYTKLDTINYDTSSEYKRRLMMNENLMCPCDDCHCPCSLTMLSSNSTSNPQNITTTSWSDSFSYPVVPALENITVGAHKSNSSTVKRIETQHYPNSSNSIMSDITNVYSETNSDIFKEPISCTSVKTIDLVLNALNTVSKDNF